MSLFIKKYGNHHVIVKLEGFYSDLKSAHSTLSDLSNKLDRVKNYKYIQDHILGLNYILRKSYETPSSYYQNKWASTAWDEEQRNIWVETQQVQLPYIIQCVATYRSACAWFNTTRNEIALLYLLEAAIEDYLKEIKEDSVDELLENYVHIASYDYINDPEKLERCIFYVDRWCNKPARKRGSLLAFFRSTNLALMMGEDFMLRVESRTRQLDLY